MSTKPVRANDPASDAGVARVDMKFEIVVIPVSDVDRAKEFYARLGWRLGSARRSDLRATACRSSVASASEARRLAQLLAWCIKSRYLATGKPSWAESTGLKTRHYTAG